jgi:hypothetical protein
MIDVKTAKTSELVAYYNAHSSNKPIKKFVDRKTAEQRVAALVPSTKDKSSKKQKGNGHGQPQWTKHKVTADGVEYGSTTKAFEALKLPLGRHIKFRMKLKAAGKLAFEHDGKTYKFAIVAA